MDSVYICAHRSNSFGRLVIVLIICIVLNLAGIWLADERFHFLQNITHVSAILYIPLFVALLIPTIIVFLLFYASISKRFVVEINEEGFSLQPDRVSKQKKYFINWRHITDYRFIDFEDNHYFAFEVNGVKSDFILDRNKYDFDSFLEIFLKRTTLPVNKE